MLEGHLLDNGRGYGHTRALGLQKSLHIWKPLPRKLHTLGWDQARGWAA